MKKICTSDNYIVFVVLSLSYFLFTTPYYAFFSFGIFYYKSPLFHICILLWFIVSYPALIYLCGAMKIKFRYVLIAFLSLHPTEYALIFPTIETIASQNISVYEEFKIIYEIIYVMLRVAFYSSFVILYLCGRAKYKNERNP